MSMLRQRSSLRLCSMSFILYLTACGIKMPYNLSETASVELHAYHNDSAEPFAWHWAQVSQLLFR